MAKRVYVIEWGYWDIQNSCILLHEQELGYERLREMCNAVVIEATERLLKELPKDEYIRPYEVLEEAEKILIERFGFNRPEVLEVHYQSDFLSGESDFRLLQFFSPDLKERVIKHNLEAYEACAKRMG